MRISLNHMGANNLADKKINANNKNAKVNDSQIKNLMKQKEDLQKQIKEMQKKAQEGNINPETGAKIQDAKNTPVDIIKDLQNQIKDIDKQIADIKAEKLKKFTEDKNKSNKKQEAKVEDKLVAFDGSLRSLKIQSSVKKKLNGRANILKCEIELDKSRGVDTEIKEKQLKNLKESMKNLESGINKDLEKINSKKSNEKKDKVTDISKAKKIKDKKVKHKETENKDKINKSNKDLIENKVYDYILKGNLLDKTM